MTRIQDKSREAYQSEPKFANSQKLQLDMLTIPHNKSSTVWVAISRWTGQWLTRFPNSWDFCLTWWTVVNPPRRFLGVISAIYIGTWLLSGTTINFIVYMKDKSLKLQSNSLPHRKGVPSHNLPTVSQGQATKHPFNKHQHVTLWTS